MGQKTAGRKNRFQKAERKTNAGVFEKGEIKKGTKINDILIAIPTAQPEQ